MKLCRYGSVGLEKPGLIDGDRRLRDLSEVVDDIGPNEISPRGLKALAAIKSGIAASCEWKPKVRRALCRDR